MSYDIGINNKCFNFQIGTTLSINESKENKVPFFCQICGYVFAKDEESAKNKVKLRYKEMAQYDFMYLNIAETDFILQN